MSNQPTLPNWLRIAAFVFAILACVVTSTLIFSPASALEQVDLQARGVDYLISMWAARQFAMGCIFFIGAWRKSVAIIATAFTFFLIMNIGDAIIGIRQHDKGLIIGAALMCVISAFILYLTWTRNSQRTNAGRSSY